MREVKVGQVWKWHKDSLNSFEVVGITNGSAHIQYVGTDEVFRWELNNFDAEAHLVKDYPTYRFGDSTSEDVQEDFKVGDYLTESDRSVVWKVSSVAANGAVKTEALVPNIASDRAETMVLEKSHQKELIKATPEQIAAFDNHPFWGVKEDEEPVVEVDMVNHPSHYNSDESGVECIQITRHRDFLIGSAFKYIWRAGLKDDSAMGASDKEIEDIEKAIWYLNEKVSLLKERRGDM